MHFKVKSYHLIKFILRINIHIYFSLNISLQICFIPRPAPHLAPLPKGAGLRQDSIVSNISIFSDTRNAPIFQTISAARLRDRRPDYLHFRKHHQPRTIPRPAPPKIQIRAESATTIIHYSSFIIHYSLPPPHLYHQCTISIPLVISIHGNYFQSIYYSCINHNIP